MLRIDENSGTLVAPQGEGLLAEAAPDRDELLSLIAGSWEAFSGEVGLPQLRLLTREPVPGVDLLALDERTGRPVVVVVTGETVEWQLARALAAVAEVAGWDADRCAGVHDALRAGESPALMIVAGGFEASALATVQWLSRAPGAVVSAYAVSVLRFGSERLLSVRREPSDRPQEPGTEVEWLLSSAARAQDAKPVAAPLASTPPPGA